LYLHYRLIGCIGGIGVAPSTPPPRSVCGTQSASRENAILVGVTAQFDDIAAQEAEARGDWATAIALVSEYAECYGHDYHRHNAHLWHMNLLVKAGLLDEVLERAEHDVHARRRLNQFLFDNGRDDELRQRAQRGDRTALYHLVRLLHARGEHAAAMQAATDIDPTDTYAAELAHHPSI
jgi:hypothetical protein